MAGSSQDKTLAPSPRRLQEAREKGQRWHSADLPIALALVGGLAGIPRYVRWVAPTMVAEMQSLWILGGTPTHWTQGVALAGSLFARLVAPIVGGLMIFGVLVQLAMQGFRIQFRLKWQGPVAHARQWLSVMMLWNLVKGIGKVAGMLVAAGVVLWSERMAFLHVEFGTIQDAWGALWHLVVPALWAAVAVFFLWAVADAIVQRQKFYQGLKMSHQDQKDETKKQEGDPTMRRRRRGLHRQLLRRSLRAVDRAAVVVTNPTHAAVALEWYATDSMAPRVVAKGWDEAAAAIRDRAYAAGVPIVQSPPLARSLMASPLDRPIAAQYWREVSVILIFVLRRRQAAQSRLSPLGKES